MTNVIFGGVYMKDYTSWLLHEVAQALDYICSNVSNKCTFLACVDNVT